MLSQCISNSCCVGLSIRIEATAKNKQKTLKAWRKESKKSNRSWQKKSYSSILYGFSLSTDKHHQEKEYLYR